MQRLFDFTDHPGRAFVLAAMLPLVPVLLLTIAAFLRNFSRAQRHTDGAANRLYWLLGGDQPMKTGGYLAVVAMLASAGLAIWGLNERLKHHDKPERWAESGDWLHIGATKGPHPAAALEIGYRIDELTALLFTMVTVVGSLIFVFSLGYMDDEAKEKVREDLTPLPPLRSGEGEPAINPLRFGEGGGHSEPGEVFDRRGRFGRFYLYLCLFASSMLNLLIADNLFQVFICWELVGACSYLLIGFYTERKSASTAANKAFIVNRIGDAGFLAAMAIAFTQIGTLNIDVLNAGIGRLSTHWHIAFGLCLFLGCAGKSAQIPLQTWLPDAMEGPTPVSALIHAATMVAAGVYLAARCYPMFAPEVLLVIAYIGLATAFVSATIALVMTDIKRVLAYSTCSQLGFMMLALGVGGWTAAVMHLLTHAFFKALLFLCAGSVIHGCHHEQDLRKMGGLRRKMPITAFTMLVGVLAISGTPFFSGWYSKDRILEAALVFGMDHPAHLALYFGPLLIAGMTAFYMFRLWFLAFVGAPRDPHIHAHESPAVMTVPLVILAMFSVGVAWGWPFWESESSAMGHVLEKAEPASVYDKSWKWFNFDTLEVKPREGHQWSPVGTDYGESYHRSFVHRHHYGFELLTFLVAAFGAGWAWNRYARRAPTPAQLADPRGLLANRWYFDWFYDRLFRRGTVEAAFATARFDKAQPDEHRPTLDGALTGIAHGAGWIGGGLRRTQTGYARQYVAALALTVLALLGMLTMTLR